MKSFKIYSLILFLLILGESAISQNHCDWSTLNDADNSYQSGNFEETIRIIDNCLNSGFNDLQKVQGYRLLAKTYLALDHDSLANQAINQLLMLDPKFQPDYLSDPTRFIQIIENIKKQKSSLIVTSVSKKAENIYETPATVILIGEKQIKNRGYLDLEAILHDLPGFDISRSNGNLYSHIYQRGYRSINTNRSLFLVDGVEENDLWSSNVYLSRQYALSNIKNIEVIYGPASTMYGSNAFLGVINVITKDPQDFLKAGKIFGADFRGGYGSYNTKYVDGTIAFGTKNRNIAFSVTGRYYLSDEQDLSKYPEYDFEPVELNDELTESYHSSLDITDPAEVADFLVSNPVSGEYYFQDVGSNIILTDLGIQRALEYDNDVYNKVSFSDKTNAYSINAKLKLYDFILGWTSWKKAEGPGAQYNDIMFMGYNEGQSWRPVHDYFYVKYDKDINPKLNISNFLRYKVHDFDKDNSIVRYRKNYLSGHFNLNRLINGDIPAWDSLYLFQKSNQLRNEFKVLYQPGPMFNIVSGFEVRFSSIQGDYTFSKLDDAERTGISLTDIPGGNHFFSRDLGVYSQAEFNFIKNLKLSLGIRFDNNTIRETEGYGNVFNPRASLVFTPGSFVFKFIYAEAFKDANNREKYSTAAGKRELPNPDLNPEKVKNMEVVIGKTFSDYLSIFASGYFSSYSNIIQEVQVQLDDGTFTNQNQAIGQAEIMGINAYANFNLNNLSAYLNYTYTLPYNLDPVDSEQNPLTDSEGNIYTKLRISDIADHQINIGGNYLLFDALNINLRANLVGKRLTGENTTVPSNPETFDPYVIFNGAVSYTYEKYGLGLQFSIFNILNTEYYSPGLDEASGVLASRLIQNKRNMYISLIYQF